MSPPSCTELRQFVADFTGLPLEQVRTDSRLLADLGVDGDDGRELLAAFGERFGVDLSHLDPERYFGPECVPPWAPLVWLGRLLRHASPMPREELVPLSVADLRRAAEAGTWEAMR